MKIKFETKISDRMEAHLDIVCIDANEKGKGLVTTSYKRNENIFELEVAYSVPMGDRLVNWLAEKEMKKAIREFDREVKFL